MLCTILSISVIDVYIPKDRHINATDDRLLPISRRWKHFKHLPPHVITAMAEEDAVGNQ